MKPFLPAACALILAACAGKAPPPAAQSRDDAAQALPSLPAQVKLPGSAGQWQSWQCSDGSRFESRLSADGRQISLRYQGREQQLQQVPSLRPVIYENTAIALFSDGSSAALGHPQSANVLSSGCRPGGVQ